MKLYLCEALEIGSYGEGDFVLGVYSSPEKARAAFEKWNKTADFPEKYTISIHFHWLDDAEED